METATRHRATMLLAPDFGYALCAAAAKKTGLPQGIDLSTVDAAWTGVEPIRSETLRAFRETFGPVGFRGTAWLPCFGMAECTLIVTSASKGRLSAFRHFCALYHLSELSGQIRAAPK